MVVLVMLVGGAKEAGGEGRFLILFLGTWRFWRWYSLSREREVMNRPVPGRCFCSSSAALWYAMVRPGTPWYALQRATPSLCARAESDGFPARRLLKTCGASGCAIRFLKHLEQKLLRHPNSRVREDQEQEQPHQPNHHYCCCSQDVMSENLHYY